MYLQRGQKIEQTILCKSITLQFIILDWIALHSLALLCVAVGWSRKRWTNQWMLITAWKGYPTHRTAHYNQHLFAIWLFESCLSEENMRKLQKQHNMMSHGILQTKIELSFAFHDILLYLCPAWYVLYICPLQGMLSSLYPAWNAFVELFPLPDITLSLCPCMIWFRRAVPPAW